MTVSAGLAALLGLASAIFMMDARLGGWVITGLGVIWVIRSWLVPPCSDHQALMSNETLQTRARNILIEISQWSILCLHCVRYWVPITGNAGHYTLHSPAHTRHGDIPSRGQRREPLNVCRCFWDLYVTKLVNIPSYLIFYSTAEVMVAGLSYQWHWRISQNRTRSAFVGSMASLRFTYHFNHHHWKVSFIFLY